MINARNMIVERENWTSIMQKKSETQLVDE